MFKRNFIGPPSVVFQRNTGELLYDERLKWLVDFEGYIRFLNTKNNFVYIDRNLVNIGLSVEQVTNTTQHDKSVVIPESMYLLQKYGLHILQNIFVYDYYWRMARNFSVHKKEDIAAAGWQEELPKPVKKMLSLQQKIPKAILHFGLLSKLCMLWSYIKNR